MNALKAEKKSVSGLVSFLALILSFSIVPAESNTPFDSLSPPVSFLFTHLFGVGGGGYEFSLYLNLVFNFFE